jgi:hypothetical protein
MPAQPLPKAAATSSPSTKNASATIPLLVVHILVVFGLEAACTVDEKALEGEELEAQMGGKGGREKRHIDYPWFKFSGNLDYESDIVEEQKVESASSLRDAESGNSTS